MRIKYNLDPSIGQAPVFSQGICHPASYLSERQFALVAVQSFGARTETGLFERFRRKEGGARAASS
jgi:hypothetical protein